MSNLTMKKMQWQKEGFIYCPDGSLDWAQNYACAPTPLLIAPDKLRIFVSFCDSDMMGRAAYVDVDPNDPKKILCVSDKPILDIGQAGHFDESGIMPTCVLSVGEKLYMYYVGYQRGQKVRYYQFSGLAISIDQGESFSRVQVVPILERSQEESLNRTAPFVIFEEGVFRMWYVAGSEWTEIDGKSMPVYNLHYAKSIDGIHWPNQGKRCLDFQNEDEYVIGRPWLIKEEGGYKMFLSSRTRSKGYRIGYAESNDGVNWTRLDQLMDLDISKTGWDSEMLAYASIFQYQDKTYMFYNGNDCGRTGFGYAILKH